MVATFAFKMEHGVLQNMWAFQMRGPSKYVKVLKGRGNESHSFRVARNLIRLTSAWQREKTVTRATTHPQMGVFGSGVVVQRKIEISFVPGDFLRSRQKRDYKSRRTKFKYCVFWGVSLKLETVIMSVFSF